MRHLDKSYPYAKPSKNRSSKDCNQILGPASIFPAYLAWSDKDLLRFAGKCKNKKSNCFLEAIEQKKRDRDALAAMAAARKAAKNAGAKKENPAK